MALVATGIGIAEVLDHVGRPLVGLGQQNPAGKLVVDHLAAMFEEGVGLGQVLAVGAFPLEQIGHGVQPEAVDSEVEPEPQDIEHRVLDGRIVVVQVRLVGEEPVPVELPAHRIVGPVRLLGVDEDDPGVGVHVAGVAPHVEVAVRPVRVPARLLEPGMGVRSVVHHEVGDDADASPVGGIDQRDEVLDSAELRQHLVEVADVVAAVAQRRVVERRQPQAVHAKPFQVIELVDQTAKVARSVGAAVVERPHQHLVEHGTLEPGAVLGDDRGLGKIVCARMFHHAVFDVAALGGVMLDVFVDTARRIHRTSNLPTRDQLESGRRAATALSKEVGSAHSRHPHRSLIPTKWLLTRRLLFEVLAYFSHSSVESFVAGLPGMAAMQALGIVPTWHPATMATRAMPRLSHLR